jgi:hypothetical protein
MDGTGREKRSLFQDVVKKALCMKKLAKQPIMKV